MSQEAAVTRQTAKTRETAKSPATAISPATCGRAVSPRLVAAASAVAAALAGCAQVAVPRNPDAAGCAAALQRGFTDILLAQGEAPPVAETLARQAVEPAVLVFNGPRPMFLRSPSGADYGFFFDRREPACLLRLYLRRQGFTTYTNNLTYIDTRTLPGCDCGR